MIEFEADSLHVRHARTVMPGRVRQGTVRLGSVFTEVVDVSGSRRGVSLRVAGIDAYGHPLDELPDGMTGYLWLSGDTSALGHLPYPVLILGES